MSLGTLGEIFALVGGRRGRMGKVKSLHFILPLLIKPCFTAKRIRFTSIIVALFVCSCS